MKQKSFINMTLSAVAASAALLLASPNYAAAHCDTLDGPVVKDALKAVEKGDVTPALKWVKSKDEKEIRKAFAAVQADAGKGEEEKEAAMHRFLETLVKVHRAGEGAPFTGLKPAGTVEPAVAEADRALANGSPETLINKVAGAVAVGIRDRFTRTAEAARHKDDSVAEGRRFVENYVEFTHYVERLNQDAVGQSHHSEAGGSCPSDAKEHGEKTAHKHMH